MPSTSYYVSQGPSEGGRERFVSLPTTAGPWGRESQHGSPPAALLARAIERLGQGPEGAGGSAEAATDAVTGRVIGRFTMELLGPVPVGPLGVGAEVLRPGRNVELCGATLYDEERGRAVARATAWRFPVSGSGPRREPQAPPHTPADGSHHDRPPSWSGGYLDAVEWRWVKGAVMDPGPAVVWMRTAVDLVEGEPMSPVQRLLSCVDSASGVSAELDPAEWGFLNTELTVHVLRPPVGEWVCLDAATTLGSGSVGLATSRVYDAQGLVARTAQALLVAPR